LYFSSASPVNPIYDTSGRLEVGDFDLWLDPGGQSVERLRKLLEPAAPAVLEMYVVSTYVNKATNEGEQCVEEVEI
jgi:putative SOS response-associated peptidase YedK